MHHGVVVCGKERLRCCRLVNSRRRTVVCLSHSSPSAFDRSSMCLTSLCLVLWLHSVSSWPAPCLCGRGQTRRERRKDNPVAQQDGNRRQLSFQEHFFLLSLSPNFNFSSKQIASVCLRLSILFAKCTGAIVLVPHATLLHVLVTLY